MEATVQTPLGPKNLRVCRDGNADNPDWIHVYEVSFPAGQRQSLDELRSLIRTGTMELDETRDQDNHVLSLTITEVFGPQLSNHAPDFLLACYTATRPDMRSMGIGSIHRSRLVELLKSEYPRYLGLISEIESTKEPGLAPEVLHTRLRRLSFFMRQGVVRLPVEYRFPSYTPGEPPHQGELLWTPFADPVPDPATLARIIRRIYIEGYALKPDDPLIGDVLAQFSGAERGHVST